jgi:DNA-binding MarR family transcriptional regulator
MTEHPHDHAHPHDHQHSHDGDQEHSAVHEVGLPGLMRFARRTYGNAIREALIEVGCDDIPRNGLFVLAAIEREQTPPRRVIESLGVSRQAVSQLLDTLVLRGFIERDVDTEDRRRMVATLTDRGHLALSTAGGVADEIDAELEERVGRLAVSTARHVLGELIAIGDAHRHESGADV